MSNRLHLFSCLLAYHTANIHRVVAAGRHLSEEVRVGRLRGWHAHAGHPVAEHWRRLLTVGALRHH